MNKIIVSASFNQSTTPPSFETTVTDVITHLATTWSVPTLGTGDLPFELPCNDAPPTYDQAGESYEVTPTLVYDGQGIIMSSGAYVRSTYGGGNFTVCFNTSTYRWAGQEWAQVNVSTPSRVHHAMAYDASRDEVVLFGGSGDYDASWDTWIWSRSTASWTLANESPTLGARSGHRLVYDPGCGRVLLIGGKSSLGGPPPTETWAWDGNASQWSRVAPAATGPSSLQDDFEVMSDDASGRALVCDGGSLWGWTYDPPADGRVAWYPDCDGTDRALCNNGKPIPSQCLGLPGQIAMGFDGSNDRMRVAHDGSLEFPDGNFSAMMWLAPSVAHSGEMTLLDKWDGTKGLWLGILAHQVLDLRVGTASTVLVPVPELTTAACWTHVAVTISAGHLVSVYVNGQVRLQHDLGPVQTLTNATQDLYVGGSAPAPNPLGAGHFEGGLDELQLYERAVTSEEVLSSYTDGPKPPGDANHVYVPKGVDLCAGDDYETIPVTVFNDCPQTAQFRVVVEGLQVVPGCPDPAAGVTGSPQTLTIPGLSYGTAKVNVYAPLDMGVFACYQATVTNTTDGSIAKADGKLIQTSSYGYICIRPVPNGGLPPAVVTPPARAGGASITGPNPSGVLPPNEVPPPFELRAHSVLPAGFYVINPGATTLELDYIVRPVDASTDAASTILTLNGLSPGTPVTGHISVAPADTGVVVVNAMATSPAPSRVQEVRLEIDVDGDSQPDPVAVIGILPIQATFKIAASAGTHGAIAPAGVIVLDMSSSQSFAITPDAGYRVDDVIVDGTSVGAPRSYTFSNVTADHTIVASFAAELAGVPGGTLPKVLWLSQPNPNPLHQTTELSLALPQPAEVSFVIHDVAGRIIAVLFEGRLSAGARVFHWDGKDAAGHPVASGVYFSRLVVDGKVLTRRLVTLD
ncbi:MAG TPA: LamG-like jellyroll fold domain-containing protein [Candidatus Eisenbacteria bacterium]